MDLHAVSRADLAPVGSVIRAAKDAAQGSRNQFRRVGRSPSQGAHGLTAHLCLRNPCLARIVADVQTTVLAVDNPGTDDQAPSGAVDR